MNFADSVHKQLAQLDIASMSQLRVCMVCLGNICRSPMAAAVLHHHARKVENKEVLVDSAGTGSWHIGEGPNFSSEAIWSKAGYQYEHIAQQFTREFFDSRDLILVMDSSNYRNVVNLAPYPEAARKVFYLRQFDQALCHIDPAGSEARNLEVPDPYGLAERAFEKVLEMVEDSVAGLVDVLNS